jgi:hypothetical protein
MKLTTFKTLLAICVVFCMHDTSGAADIFSPPPKPDTTSIKYPTVAAFLSATKSGEIPDLLQDKFKQYINVQVVSRSVEAIIRDEYKIPMPKGGNPAFLGQCLTKILEHELGGQKDGDAAAQFQLLRKYSVPTRPESAKFLDAFDSLAKDYTIAVREYISIKQERDGKNKAAEAERKRQADMAMQAQAEAQKQKLQQVLDSPAYKLWQASSRVEAGLRMIKFGQQALDHDDAVQRESGVIDLTARRSAGEKVVTGKQLVESAFAEYRKLGGTAQTPEEVRAGADPLKEYR